MSRCFPYPPPGYSTNGATYEALIESIKLQKENDKAKVERKKEKRAKKDKNKKEKRKDEEKAKAKLQKNPNEYQQDAHKGFQSSTRIKEAQNKTTGPSISQLEKSDLTEEHGQPISSHKPSYSSDNSTQNSNKRRKDDDDDILQDGSSGHGKPIKIRLLKKQKGSDSSKETLCPNSERTDPQTLSGADVRLNTRKLSTSGNADPSVPSLVSSNRNTGVPATSGRENNAAHGILASQAKLTPNLGRPGTKNIDSQGVYCHGQQVAPGSALRHEIQTSNQNKPAVTVPSRSKKSNVEVRLSSRQQTIPSYGRSVLPQSQLDHEMPTPSSNVPLAPSVPRKTDVGTGVVPPNNLKPGSDLNKTRSSRTGKRSINEMDTRYDKKEKNPPAGTSKGQKVGLTRAEKKMRKKHSKYEKLIGSWVPPVLEAPAQLLDDEDWLSRSGKTVGSRSSSSRDDVEETRGSSLWQPCARFLVDAYIYALPYTVPF